MSFLNWKIERPGVAFGVIFMVGALYSKYGAIEGAAILFAVFSTVVIYKMITR